jgi:hypothetical protein
VAAGTCSGPEAEGHLWPPHNSKYHANRDIGGPCRGQRSKDEQEELAPPKDDWRDRRNAAPDFQTSTELGPLDRTRPRRKDNQIRSSSREGRKREEINGSAVSHRWNGGKRKVRYERWIVGRAAEERWRGQRAVVQRKEVNRRGNDGQVKKSIREYCRKRSGEESLAWRKSGLGQGDGRSRTSPSGRFRKHASLRKFPAREMWQVWGNF